MKKRLFLILSFLTIISFLVPEIFGPKDEGYAGSIFTWNFTLNFPLTIIAFILSMILVIFYRNALRWQRVVSVIVFIPIFLKVSFIMTGLISIILTNDNGNTQINHNIKKSESVNYWDSIQKRPHREITREEWDKIYENAPQE